MRTFDGDIVQAIQALKETKPEPTTDLNACLHELLLSLENTHTHCHTRGLEYHFVRCERQLRDVLMLLFPDLSRNTTPFAAAPIELLTSSLESSKQIQKIALGPYEVPRLFNGFWQLSSPAWGSGTAEAQDKALIHLVESGLVAADMADHYVCRLLFCNYYFIDSL